MFLFFFLIVGVFAFKLIGQCREERKRNGREKGGGIGKLGTPEVRLHCISAQHVCPNSFVRLCNQKGQVFSHVSPGCHMLSP